MFGACTGYEWFGAENSPKDYEKGEIAVQPQSRMERDEKATADFSALRSSKGQIHEGKENL